LSKTCQKNVKSCQKVVKKLSKNFITPGKNQKSELYGEEELEEGGAIEEKTQ
jgi:hypothetical protein